MTTLRLPSICVLALLASVGCADFGLPPGENGRERIAEADQIVYALGSRFGPVQPTPLYQAARAALSRSALVPSRLLADSSIWTSSGEGWRELRYGGRMGPAGYELGLAEAVGQPTEPGEYLRTIRLTDLGDGQFRWSVRDELAVGIIAPSDFSGLFRAALSRLETASEAQVRTAHATALPRTTAAAGLLFSLDELTILPKPDGGSQTKVNTSVRPDRIRAEYPLLARYLDRYVSPLRLSARVVDERGISWGTVEIADRTVAVDVRSEDGQMKPLQGRTSVGSDSLRLQLDISTRVRLFGIGARNLVGEVTIGDSISDHRFTVRFREEPEWDFPPLVARFLRAPLGRPFQGDGIVFRLGLTSQRNRASLIRDYTVVVEESTIVGWIGTLGSMIVSDFRDGAEREGDEFNARVANAFRQDLRALARGR